MQMLDWGTRLARKAHPCSNCNRVIEPGESYGFQKIKNDGYLYTWKSCAHCEAVAGYIQRTDRYAFDPDYGLDMHEWLRECGPDSLLGMFEKRWRDSLGALLPVPVLPTPSTEEPKADG